MFKAKQFGIDSNDYNWIENWLSKWRQGVVINVTASEQGPVTSGVKQGPFLGPILFIIYINDIDVGLKNFIWKLADGTEIRKSIITDRERLSLQ